MDIPKDHTPDDGRPSPNDVDGRAFEGHPDHPPQVPDQPSDGNEDLLRPGS